MLPPTMAPAAVDPPHRRGFTACLISLVLAGRLMPVALAAEPEPFVHPDALGNPAEAHMPSLPGTFTPPAGTRQIPGARPGTKVPATRIERLRGGVAPGFSWFSSRQPGLAPYLSSLDELGNAAVVPGALVADEPIAGAIQHTKYRLSGYGFHYQMQQAFEYATSTHVPSSARNLGYYTFDGHVRQTFFAAPAAAGWLSTEVVGGSGLGGRSRRTDPMASLGSLVDPIANRSPVNGLAVIELAWQQSLAGGRVVTLIGSLDQTNYLDTNAYANSTFAQFQNDAFGNSQVLPLTAGTLGMNLQWQPIDDAYLMLGVGPNDTRPGRVPWEHVDGGNMSYVFEMGYVPDDLLHLGPGAYRLQPFAATVDGTSQGGVGLNLNQQLGPRSPLGLFGRFGVGGPAVTTVNGASAQIAAGIVLQHPLRLAHLLPEASTDFLGAGFVWSQPATDRLRVANRNEYGVEVLYTFQITPTTVLKPDLQVIWNPVRSAAVSESVVFQVPLVATW
jgi:hypothetical protein